MEDRNEFKGYWALILGGSRGLGLASAKELASHGMNICIVHRDRKSELAGIEAAFTDIKNVGVEVLSFNKDALLKETMNEVISSIPKGKVKVLLHSIAKGSLKPLVSIDGTVLSKEDLDITLYAMGTSWYTWAQALISKRSFSENARNLSFTSEGNNKVWPGYAAISAAKATLEALMRSMAVEFAPLGITSNCIQAGTTLTTSFEMIPGSEKLAEMSIKRNPFNRMTNPQDVAKVVYLVCKDEANWINGTIVKADGGESLR